MNARHEKRSRPAKDGRSAVDGLHEENTDATDMALNSTTDLLDGKHDTRAPTD
jgi:hypothetical protein